MAAIEVGELRETRLVKRGCKNTKISRNVHFFLVFFYYLSKGGCW